MAASDTSSPLRRTPLYDAHEASGARIIDFGGWAMPVQYRPGIIKEHKNVREAVGLFDVSHMGEARVRGDRAGEAVQRVITNDVSKLVDGAAVYTVMCHPDGGIVDDCIVYRWSAREYLIILNAANTDKDLAWLREHCAPYGVDVVDESEATALIAVQGPKAVGLVDRLSPAALADVPGFHFVDAEVAGVRCMVARTGYTGEDGFELACPADGAPRLWAALLSEGAADGVMPIGLGARDTLRIEARLCLYGNDIDDTTNPYEAGLGWVVKPAAGDFIGKDALAAIKQAGPTRKLVGFAIADKGGIARPDYPVVDRDRPEGEQHIGRVTSGTKGISVPGAIGMAYVPVADAAVGAEITIECRGKDVPATIVKGKFYQRGAG
ncbi:glycine cleavage system aminomethyltransferase GcvT [Haliangium sp.]|uniref:glycine cleavage system aminomethyltransferase GcvT n=1 Tax=Haliangium sp. TaxID=2663208 RepID=UPI003D1197BF